MSGLTPQVVAETMGVCVKTVRKWVARFQAEGVAGLLDRSSRPRTLHRPTPSAMPEAIERLRRQRFTGQQIARDLAVSPATVSRVPSRLGLNRIAALEPAEPVRRYERARPGDLIHVEIKKLGPRTGQSTRCGIGWEHLHRASDDQSRLAYSEILPDEKRGSCLTFLFDALRFFRRHGVAVERVMTDNGPAFESWRYAKALRRLGIAHRRTRPYAPKTNRKCLRAIGWRFSCCDEGWEEVVIAWGELSPDGEGGLAFCPLGEGG